MLHLHHQHQLRLTHCLSVRLAQQHQHSPLTHYQLHSRLTTNHPHRVAYSTISNVHRLCSSSSSSHTHLNSHSRWSRSPLHGQQQQQQHQIQHQQSSSLHLSSVAAQSNNTTSSTTQDARDRLARIRARAAQQEAASQQQRNQGAVGSTDNEGRFAADSQYQPSSSFNPLPSSIGTPPSLSHLPPPPNQSMNVLPSLSPQTQLPFASPLGPGDATTSTASIPIRPFLPVRGRDELTGGKRTLGAIDIISALVFADLLSIEAMNIQMSHIESLFPYFDPLESVLVMECANIALFGLLFRLISAIQFPMKMEKLSPPHEGLTSPHDNWFKNWMSRRAGPRTLWGKIWRWLAFMGIGMSVIVFAAIGTALPQLTDPRFSMPHREIELAMARFDERRKLNLLSMLEVTLIEVVFRGLVFIHSLRRIGLLPAYVISGFASTLAQSNVYGHSENSTPAGEWGYAFVYRLTRSLFAPVALHTGLEPMRYYIPSMTSPMHPLTEQQHLQTLMARFSLGLQNKDVSLVANAGIQFILMYGENPDRELVDLVSTLTAPGFEKWLSAQSGSQGTITIKLPQVEISTPDDTRAKAKKQEIVQALTIADSSLLSREMEQEINAIFAALDRKKKGHLSLSEWSYLASLDSRRHCEFNSACQIIATAPSQKDAKPRLINGRKKTSVTIESIEKAPRRTITPINMNEINIAQPYESALSSLPVVSDISVPPLSILPYWQQRQQSDMSMEKVSLFEQIWESLVPKKEKEKNQKANVEPLKSPIAQPIQPHPSSRLTSAEQRTRAQHWYSIRHTTEYESLFHYSDIREAHKIDLQKVKAITDTLPKANNNKKDDAIETKRWADTRSALSAVIQPSREKLSFELNGCTRDALAAYVLKELKMRPEQTVEWLKRAQKVITGEEAHPTQQMWQTRTTEKKA